MRAPLTWMTSEMDHNSARYFLSKYRLVHVTQSHAVSLDVEKHECFGSLAPRHCRNLALGIHMEPWAAQNWTQDCSVVLNDTIEQVLDFAPIPAI